MKAAIILEQGFEDIEAIACKDILVRGGVEVTLFANEKILRTSHNTQIIPDEIINDNIKDYDVIILPGGIPGTYNLRDDKKVNEYLEYFNKNKKLIAAICAAPTVLVNIIGNRKVTVYPEEEFINIVKNNYVNENVVVDENIITAKGAGQTFNFAFEILNQLGINPEKVKKGMMV